MLVKGVAGQFSIFIIVLSLVLIALSGKIKLPKPLKFLALDKIPEIVGRCTETNRPLFADPGRWNAVTSVRSAVGFAGMTILSYVAKLCAKYNTKLVIFTQNAPILSWMEATILSQYTQYPNSIKPEVRYIPDVLGNIYEANLLLSMEREKAGGFISLGPLATSVATVAEGASRVGAISLAGTDVMEPMAFLAVACDYVMIGEEIFAAAAIVSEDQTMQNVIGAQDLSKSIAIAAMLLGAILSGLGIPWLSTFLKM